MNRFLATVSLALLAYGTNSEAKVTDYYVLENIPPPKLLLERHGQNGTQTDGLDFMPDGRLVACFVAGEVFTLHPKTKEWTLFADGLHTPLGVVALNDKEVMVSQRPELTLLRDVDGDGKADEFESFCDDFGISGNYHEFHFGPVRDKEGNFYVSLGTASSGADVRHEKRGLFDKRSYLQRMYSSVPYRGWVLKVTPERKLVPFASGLRTPNGLGFDLDGNLFVTDNQGDWVGTSKLHHVEEGKFYGHPGSLIWKKDWGKGRPVDKPLAKLDSLRETAAVLFPHGLMANSPSQPLVDSTGGKFGPYQGQLLVGEMNKRRIMRVMLEEVGGKLQGACAPFFDGNGLSTGNNRLCFSKDGKKLWIGHSSHGWAGSRGIQTLSWTGKTPPDALRVSIIKSGFALTFTSKMDEASALETASYKIKSYSYKYHIGYGSPQVGTAKVQVEGAELSNDGKTIKLKLNNLKPRKLYEFFLTNLKTAKGEKLLNPLVVYNAYNLRE